MNELDINTEPLNFNPPEVPKSEVADETAWEPPILFGDIQTAKIDTSLLPSWLGTFAQDISHACQTPPEMAIMFSLSILATCLQKKVEISPNGNDYKEPVNLWTVTSLPPSSRKSAIVSHLVAPIKAFEKQQSIRMEPLIEEHEATKAVNKRRVADLETKAAKAESEEERKSIINEIGQLRVSLLSDMRAPLLFTSDATPEQLQNLLAEHGEKMSFLSDEGGIFEIMSGLYSDGKVNLDVFLQAYSGTSVRVNRAQRSVILDSPALTFGLTVQPEIISSLARGDKRRLRGIGALARFLYCLPASNIGSRDVTKDASIPAGSKYLYGVNIERLLKMEPAQDADGKPTPFLLTLDEEARAVFYEFADFIEKRQGDGREFEPIQDWTGKLAGTALRIAALFHVAEYGTNPSTVGKCTMENAVMICRQLVLHAQAAFDEMSIDPVISDAKYLFESIVRNSEPLIRKRDLHRLPRFKNGKVDRLHRAIDVLVDRHVLSHPQYLETRKPTEIYTVNPILIVKKKNNSSSLTG